MASRILKNLFVIPLASHIYKLPIAYGKVSAHTSWFKLLYKLKWNCFAILIF